MKCSHPICVEQRSKTHLKTCDWYKKHMRCMKCQVMWPRPPHIDVKHPAPGHHPRCPHCNSPLRLRPPHQTRRYIHMGKKKMRTECIYMTDSKFIEKIKATYHCYAIAKS